MTRFLFNSFVESLGGVVYDYDDKVNLPNGEFVTCLNLMCYVLLYNKIAL